MAGQVYVQEFPAPELDREAVFRYAGMAVPSREVLSLLDSVLEETAHRLAYRVCWAEFPLHITQSGLDLGFARTESEDLKRHLQGCDSVIAFGATVGTEPDRLMARYARISPARALMLQALGAERIESLCDLFCSRLSRQAADRGLKTLSRFSPGYGDLPLEFQRDLFCVLDCPRKIGVTLNDSLLMSPTKSVTALIGMGRNTEDCVPSGCSSCSKTDCAFRRPL